MSRVLISDILEAAQEVTPFTIGEIIGTHRFAPLSRVRQACFYLAREAGYSYPAIGKRIGGKDHSTAVHGFKACQDHMARKPEYAEQVRRIRMRAVWLAERRKFQIDRATQGGPAVTVRFAL